MVVRNVSNGTLLDSHENAVLQPVDRKFHRRNSINALENAMKVLCVAMKYFVHVMLRMVSFMWFCIELCQYMEDSCYVYRMGSFMWFCMCDSILGGRNPILNPINESMQ